MSDNVKYGDIIELFGRERQARQAMEECAELIQAVNKAVRYPDDPVRRLDLIEEIADVKIMILQLEEMFNIHWKESMQMFKFKEGRLAQKYLKEMDRLTNEPGSKEKREEE